MSQTLTNSDQVIEALSCDRIGDEVGNTISGVELLEEDGAY
jgi:hypothetical protein